MTSLLEAIEEKIRAFVESSATLIPENTSLHLLSERLVAALQEGMKESIEGGYSAPAQYVIHLRPEVISEWTLNPDWQDALTKAMQDAALENKVRFEGLLSITFMPDERLLPGDLIIEITESESCGEVTAAIPINILLNDVPETDTNVHAYLIVDGNKHFPLELGIINIGRRKDNHLVLDDPRVSRDHAQLRNIHGHYTLFDLNSSGGTFVNNEKVTRRMLATGDVITLGGVPLIYGEDEPGSGTDAFRTQDQEEK